MRGRESGKKETGEREAVSRSKESCHRWWTSTEDETSQDQEREHSVERAAESICVAFVG